MDKLRNFLPKHERLTSSVERPMQWIVKSGCHFSCMEQSSGIQVVASIKDRSMNIQLCQAQIDVSAEPRWFSAKLCDFLIHSYFQACDKLQTTREFATKLCKNYQSKVRGLSGSGIQISPSVNDPDRGCKVACQDEYIAYRFYLVNGEQGYFPFGTKCSRSDDNRYCVNGKCLEFDENDIPLVEPHISLAHYRSKRWASESMDSSKSIEQIANTPNEQLNGFLKDVEHQMSRDDGKFQCATPPMLKHRSIHFISDTIDGTQVDMRTPVQVPIHY